MWHQSIGCALNLSNLPTINNINTVIIPFNVTPGLQAKPCRVQHIGFFCVCAHREGETEDEMVAWHPRLSGHEFE